MSEQAEAAQAEAREKINNMEKQARERLPEMIEGVSSKEERLAVLMKPFEGFFGQDFVKKMLGEEAIEEMRAEIKAANELDDEEAFADAVIKAAQPMFELRATHARQMEDSDAREIMEIQGFTPVNERISYGIHGDHLQLHLAPSFEVKDKIEEYYRDGLEKVVDIVRENPDIKMIGGSSWLNATKTYGEMKKRLGFKISETPQEVIDAHFPESDRPIKNATMTREEFLARYDQE
ncbi:MAG: hypothetical protein ABH846_03230 [Patescibacteria group bacterium]